MKVTKELFNYIKKDLYLNFKPKELAEHYEISTSTVSRIKHSKDYKDYKKKARGNYVTKPRKPKFKRWDKIVVTNPDRITLDNGVKKGETFTVDVVNKDTVEIKDCVRQVYFYNREVKLVKEPLKKIKYDVSAILIQKIDDEITELEDLKEKIQLLGSM